MLQPYIESATALSDVATSGQISYYWMELGIVQLISEYLATLLTFLSSCSLFTYVLCQKRQSSVCNAMHENKIYSSSLHILERDVVKINQTILHLLLFEKDTGDSITLYGTQMSGFLLNWQGLFCM